MAVGKNEVESNAGKLYGDPIRPNQAIPRSHLELLDRLDESLSLVLDHGHGAVHNTFLSCLNRGLHSLHVHVKGLTIGATHGLLCCELMSHPVQNVLQLRDLPPEAPKDGRLMVRSLGGVVPETV